MLSFRSVLIWFVGILATVLPVPSEADPLPKPEGVVILSVTGPMQNSNDESGVSLDLQMLQSIGTVSFMTTTPWTDGMQEFTGVPLSGLLEFIDGKAETLRVTAINEYQIDIPASDAVEGGPILAWAQDGNLLSIREKGPLWLIYPYDSNPAYRSDEIFARSVWQVVQIELIP